MKTVCSLLHVRAVFLLVVLSSYPLLKAAPLYDVRELFAPSSSRFFPAENQSGNVRLLNNRGEVLYTTISNGYAFPGLWLARTNYGLAPGLNDLVALPPAAAGSRIPLRLADDGTFYHFVSTTQETFQVHRGTVSEESYWQASRFYRDILDNPNEGAGDRVQGFVGHGVNSDGTLFGSVDVGLRRIVNGSPQYSGVSECDPTVCDAWRYRGLFVGELFIPWPERGMDAMPCAPWNELQPDPRSYYRRSASIIASSRSGTFVTQTHESCAGPDHTQSNRVTTVAVVQPGATRVIAEATEPGAFSTTTFAVNHAGDVAMATNGAVWFFRSSGLVQRVPVNGMAWAPTIQLNNAGVALLGYVHSNGTGGFAFVSSTGPTTIDLSPAGYRLDALYSYSSFNDRGELLALVSPLTNSQRKVYALLSPAAALQLNVSNRVALGEIFTVVATLTNLSTETLTSVALTSPLNWSGDGGVELVSGPNPSAIPDLTPGAGVRMLWTFRATNGGPVQFQAQARATKGSTVSETLPATADTLIRDEVKGDLLIRRDVESDAQFGLDDVYQPIASGLQRRTNIVSEQELSLFHVRVQNDDAKPRQFVVKATEFGGNGWSIRYLFENRDISGAIRAGGAVLPEMGPHESHALTLVVRATNAPPGASTRTALTLRSATSPEETLDEVEAVAERPLEIIVNSTADLSDLDATDCCCDTGRTNSIGEVECTLRAAIEFANRRPGKDRITFRIPASDTNTFAGVPRIAPDTELPAIMDAVVVDGWSQKAESDTPPVELSGTKLPKPGGTPVTPWDWFGAASGLRVLSPNCEIFGLTINHFLLAGIELVAGGNIVAGNFIGTDPSGRVPKANGASRYYYSFDEETFGCGLLVRSAHNQIGGRGARLANLISGAGNPAHGPIYWPSDRRLNFNHELAPPGIILAGAAASGNRIEGNIIGPDLTGRRKMLTPVPESVTKPEAIWVYPHAGILVSDGSANIIGGEDPGAGNIISRNAIGVWINGNLANGNVVAGNVFGADRTRTVSLPNRTAISVDGVENRIGGNRPAAANAVVSSTEFGINVRGRRNIIEGNRVGAPGIATGHGIVFSGADGPIVRHNDVQHCQAGISVFTGSNSIIYSNRFTLSDWAAINFWGLAENGHRITQNAIFNNRGGGIDLAPGLVSANDYGDYDVGPNTLLNYPELAEIAHDYIGGREILRGSLNTTPTLPGTVRTFRVEIFANRKSPLGFGEGEIFLGYTNVDVGFSGNEVFSFDLPFPYSSGWFISAVAIDPDGNTSEFSRSLLSCISGDTDEDGVCDDIEARVPNRPGQSPAFQSASASSQPKSSGFGDGNGDGVPDSAQPNIGSVISGTGSWITTALGNGLALQDFQPNGAPTSAPVPQGYVFPLGWFRLAVSNMPPGAEVTVTNFFETTDYDAVLAFGPTPARPEPHWFEIPAVFRSPDQLILTIADGGAGDLDAQVNGRVVMFYGPAQRSSRGPLLRVIDVATTPLANPHSSGTGPSNEFAVTTVLSWPATPTNFVVESTEQLSPGTLWSRTEGEPALVGNEYRQTNYSPAGAQFFRLREVIPPVPQPPSAEEVEGAYEWNSVGAATWSDAIHWLSSSRAQTAPVSNGWSQVDVTFGPSLRDQMSLVDGAFGIRSLSVSAAAGAVSLILTSGLSRIELGAGGLNHFSPEPLIIQPSIRLHSDQTWNIQGPLRVGQLDLQAHTLHLSGAAPFLVTALSGAAGSKVIIDKEGVTELATVGAVPFRGVISAANGVLTNTGVPLNSASRIELLGGRVFLPANFSFSSTGVVQAAAGTLHVNGAMGGFGELEIAGNADIALGSGTGLLTFARASLLGTNSILRVSQWQGTAGSAGTGRRLFVTTPPSASILSRITFTGAFGTGALRLASGEIVPLPVAASVLPPNPAIALQPYGAGVSTTIVSVTGTAFTQALRVVTSQAQSQPFNAGLTLRTTTAVSSNDNLRARFWVRRIAPSNANASLQFNFELASGSFEKSVQYPITLTNGEWQEHVVRFRSRNSYAANAAQVSFWAGYGSQTVELGGLEVLNYKEVTPP
jgi:hypothetical protein